MSSPPQALPPARPPSIAPLELERLRGSVRAGLFAEPAKPPRLGRYSLLRCIGHGGMGVVYAAHDEELDREVAIKLLRTEIARGDDQRLAQEARALARLSHPNVVAIYDVGVHDQQRFIAMELVAGLDLRRWLAAPRPLREVLRVFAAAGHGLAAAHAVGLVHRDFKPDNVLVGDDGRPRVLDFGLARPPERADTATPGKPPVLPTGIDPFATTFTSTGMLLGTPAYMAPEQYLGDPADARSDQFSFAVSLFHAVYGERPFAGEIPPRARAVDRPWSRAADHAALPGAAVAGAAARALAASRPRAALRHHGRGRRAHRAWHRAHAGARRPPDPTGGGTRACRLGDPARQRRRLRRARAASRPGLARARGARAGRGLARRRGCARATTGGPTRRRDHLALGPAPHQR
ncbi:MAG: serine/threonine protein kinase [Deltaproteobacteria bacterium]|nr:serine/threonine protein kinase [Deltaproteobacteria bacterium]